MTKPDSIRIEIRTGDDVRVIEITEIIGGMRLGMRLDVNGGDGGFLPDHRMISLVALGRTEDTSEVRQ